MMTKKSKTQAYAHWGKTLLSLLLSVIMLAGLLPVTTLAEETSADEVKTIIAVEGRSYHMGVSGYDAPAYGQPNDYKSRPEIEITKITFADETTMENPSRDVIHTLDGSGAKNWERQAADESWENYSMTTYPKFIEGTYRYVVKLRVESVENVEYQFGESVAITITDEYHGGEAQWTQEKKVFKNEWYIISPKYTVEDYGYLIDNTRIEGKQLSIGETNVDKAIKEIDLNSSVMGGTKPYHFAKVEGSPAWIDVSENGIVSGAPTETTAKATELKVKVTDSGTPAKTVTLTIPVGRTFPATDERIDLAYVQVELKDVLPALGASTDLFPRFTLVKAVTTTGQEITADQIPDNAIVFNHAMGNMGCWQKKNEETGSYEGYYKTTFDDFGTYRFGMLLRIQNTGTIAFGEQYKLSDRFQVWMYEGDKKTQWGVRNVWSFETYSTVEVNSPDYEVNNDARDLTGNVAITCTVRTGEPISTNVSGCNAPAGNLRYQWQIQSAKDGSWSNWGKLTESGSMSRDRVQADIPDVPGKYGTGAVRVIVSAVGYDGKLVSKPRPINPAVHTEEPAMPKLWYFPDKGGVIFVRNSKGSTQLQEYLLSKKPMTQEQLDAAKKRTTEEGEALLGLWTKYGDVSVLGSENVFKAQGNTLYYVYTRLAGGRGYLAGKEYRYSTIYTGDTSDSIYLKEITLDGYTSFGAGNTIYIKSGTEVTLTVTGSPATANTWSNVYFREQSDSPTCYSVSEGSPINQGTKETAGFGSHTIKIKGNSAGTGDLVAISTESSGEGTVYGRWRIVVYDDVSNINPAVVEVVNPPVYSDVTLGVGDTYTPANAKPTIATRPAGALNGKHFEWRVEKPNNAPGGIGFEYQKDNGYIKVDPESGEVKALKAHEAGVDSRFKTVVLCIVRDDDTVIYGKEIASYSVTVEAAAAQEGVLLVNPGSLSIEKGETAPLTAQVVGLPEGAEEGSYKWTSGETKVAAVSVPVSDGNKAEVKAIGHGDTTIVVTYTYTVNGTETVLSAAVPVAVHRWDGWQKVDGTTHQRGCEDCSAVETANHTPEQDGTTWRCADCGYVWENAGRVVLLDANGGTVSSSAALLDRDSGKPDFLPTPERSGYSFSGWYTARNGGTKVTCDTVVDASVSTLYAHWIADYHNDDNSGGNHYDRRQNSAANAGTGSGSTTATKPVKSPGTGDAGIVLYAAMGLLSLSGGAWIVGRKRKDK